MKAWRSGDVRAVEGLALTEMAEPMPGPGELLVQISAAALNFSDLLMIADKYQVRPPRPFTPGQEVAGEVIAAGPGTRFAPGSRIASKVLWGGFAERALVRDEMAIRVPDGKRLSEAVALPVVYTTALVALTECAHAGPDKTVLVHAAAGGTGIAAVQVAKALGARVIATAGNVERCTVAAAQGADVTINYGKPDWSKAVLAATGEKGAEIVFDPVGGDVTLQSLRCLANDGELLIVGFSSGTIPAIPANRILLKRAVVRGIYWDHETDAEMLARVTERLTTLYADGQIRPVVSDGYALEDLPRALGDLSARRGVGKLVLNVSSSSAEGAR